MKNVKSILSGGGSAMLAGLVLATYAPKAAYAAAATVTPYAQTISCYTTTSNQCTASFPVVPPNMRLVVQHIMSSVDTPTALAVVEFAGSGGFFPVLHTFQGNDPSGNNIYVASQPLLYYYTAGQQPTVYFDAQAASFQFISASITLTGFLVPMSASLPE